MAASRAVNEAALAAIDPAGTSGVRIAHIPVIASIDPEGTRLGMIATRIGISRQAVAALVRDLTAAGVTAIVDDPLDGRAQIVTLTEGGSALCERAADYLEAREQEWRAIYGDAQLLTVREVLTGLSASAE